MVISSLSTRKRWVNMTVSMGFARVHVCAVKIGLLRMESDGNASLSQTMIGV